MGRREPDISEELCDELTDQRKISRFKLQVDKAAGMCWKRYKGAFFVLHAYFW
jgi:hypothetical protein